MNPLVIDLYCGVGGFSQGFLDEGYDCIGFDIEQHVYSVDGGKVERYPGQLVVQDVLTVHGSQFAGAACIVASPPCQEFSYRAMPWKRARALAPEEIGVAEPGWWAKPEGKMSADELDEWRAWKRDHPKPAPSLALVNACFRIQREASDAAGHHIPMVVENVKGMQRSFGRARWSFGSFFLWGDVPALMPATREKVMKAGIAHRPDGATNFHRELDNGKKVPGFRFDGSKRSFQTACVNTMNGRDPYLPEGLKHGGDWFSDPSSPSRQGGQVKTVAEGRKGAGGSWIGDGYKPNQHGRNTPSNSPARKRASAMIAKIPLPLSTYPARTFHPRNAR
jgi:C-5 cytosine-specific DNA methylase